MKVLVNYGSDASTMMDLDVQPMTSVKKVKQQVMDVHKPPAWANTSLLSLVGGEEFFENKQTLNSCHVGEGSVLRFAYAKKMDAREKLDLAMQGVDMGDVALPCPMTINTMPR